MSSVAESKVEIHAELVGISTQAPVSGVHLRVMFSSRTLRHSQQSPDRAHHTQAYVRRALSLSPK